MLSPVRRTLIRLHWAQHCGIRRGSQTVTVCVTTKTARQRAQAIVRRRATMSRVTLEPPRTRADSPRFCARVLRDKFREATLVSGWEGPLRAEDDKAQQKTLRVLSFYVDGTAAAMRSRLATS